MLKLDAKTGVIADGNNVTMGTIKPDKEGKLILTEKKYFTSLAHCLKRYLEYADAKGLKRNIDSIERLHNYCEKRDTRLATYLQHTLPEQIESILKENTALKERLSKVKGADSDKDSNTDGQAETIS